MGAVGLIGREAGAVQGSGGGDAGGKGSGGGEGVAAAHAVTDAADFLAFDRGVGFEKIKIAAGVFHDQFHIDGLAEGIEFGAARRDRRKRWRG